MRELPERTDVVIVGAGFAGCATAWALGRRGLRAVVLEREVALGRYASGRGAGLGRQLAEDDETTSLTVQGAALLREELALAWAPTGGLLTFDDSAHAHTYLARAERHGVATTVIDRAVVAARWPQLAALPIASGLAIASDGVIDAPALLAHYADGQSIALGAGVTAIEPGGQGALVRTTRGAIEARVVVDASGAWAGANTGDPPLEAYARNLFVLEVAPPGAAPYLWHLGASELYVRAAGDGVLATACDTTLRPPEDAQPDPVSARVMQARFADVAPALAHAAISKHWACQRVFAPDRRMRLGRDPGRPWLVWAAALGGHGATASPAIGERVADAVLAALT